MTRVLQNKLKRQRERRQAVFLVCGCTLVVGLVLLVFTLTSPHYADEHGNGSTYAQTAGEVIQAPGEQAQETAGEDAPALSLGLGGDVSFGLAVADIIAQQGPAYPWADICPYFAVYDFTAVSMESPLCRGTTPNQAQPSVYLRGDASCAAPMAEAGIDAVCLANDHIMDYGAAGLEETLNTLRAVGLGACGAGASRIAAERPLVLKAENGATVALLSFCDVAPPSFAAGEDMPGVSVATLEGITGAVVTAAQGSDYVAVFVHWGEVGSTSVTERQREVAAACASAGADIVVGCHPRVIQGIEVISGVPVIYSLGNLVFSADSEAGKNAVLAGCRFSAGRLSSLELVPLRVEGAKPTPIAGEQAIDLLEQLKTASPGVDLLVSPTTGTATLVL